MKKKIAVIIIYKLNITDYSAWNFKKLRKLFNVTFFDLSNIFLTNKKAIRIYKNNSLENKLKNYYILTNISKFKKLVKGFDYILDYSYFFLNNYYKKSKVNNFLQAININKYAKKITILNGSLPNFFHHNFLGKLKFLFFIIYLILIYKKFYFIYFYIKKIIFFLKKNIINNIKINDKFHYDYVMVSDIFWEKFANLRFIKSKKLYTHYKDYEKYLLYKNTKKLKLNNYVVFLDEDIFDHPDVSDLHDSHLFVKGDKDDLKIEYYSILNNFFNNFERHTGFKVIIAAHPKTIFTKNNNYFNNRTFIKNNTFELIKKSRGVFAHYSTSISIAILLNKPINLLFSEIMFDLGYSSKILSMFLETKARFIDMGSDKIKYSDLIIKNKYNLNKHYIKKYIKHPMLKKDYSMWDNLLKNLIEA